MQPVCTAFLCLGGGYDMIVKYKNGQEMLEDNKELLSGNKYQAVFFYWDAPLLTRGEYRRTEMIKKRGMNDLSFFELLQFTDTAGE